MTDIESRLAHIESTLRLMLRSPSKYSVSRIRAALEDLDVIRKVVTTPEWQAREEYIAGVAEHLVEQASIIMGTLKATKGDAESSGDADASSVTMLRDFMCAVARYERRAADVLISLVSTDA